MNQPKLWSLFQDELNEAEEDDQMREDGADSDSEPEPSHSDIEDSGSVASLSGIEDSESSDTSDSEAVGNAGKSNSYS